VQVSYSQIEFVFLFGSGTLYILAFFPLFH